MLESVLIQNFKGFKNTSIGPFRMVNLIIGGQNVGKTSVLEVVYATATLKLDLVGGVFRQNEGQDLMRFNKAFSDKKLYLHALSETGSGYALAAKDMNPETMPQRVSSAVGFGHLKNQLRAWSIGAARPKLNCSAVPLYLPPQAQLVELFGKLILARKKKELITLLRNVEPRLESLDAIAPDGEQRVYAELDGLPQALPLTQLGHGFSRLVHLFSELLVSETQLALIDEVENGIHYSALPTLFQGIKAVAQERQVQSLITTHSWDCLRAACEVFEDTPDMFQVIRLERHDDDVKAVCIDGERMLRLMAEEREVR